MLKFGTDGIRGVANVDLTPELVVALGRAAARVVDNDRFLIGRDTRVSGGMLQAALSAGLAAEGAAVVDLGVLPTPAIAHLAATRHTAAAVVSASHNPFADNGIKLFGTGGRKLDDATEDRLEAELRDLLSGAGAPTVVEGEAVGLVTSDQDGAEIYIEHVVRALDERRLDGMTVVLDCANGAVSEIAPQALRDLGADVRVLFNRPDGTNINEACGSTYPEGLQEAVVEEGADAGLAFDGDADRVLAVDETGELVDGDRMLAVFAKDLKARGKLAQDTVVVTVMTNLGFRLAMEAEGVTVVETPVGDRHVLAALEAGRYSLGGEQSGHLVFPEWATTGDGLLTGVLLLDVLARSGGSLSALAGPAMERLPQVLHNVSVLDLSRLEEAKDIWEAVKRVESRLGGRGRVLLRKSGTEPLVRVMVEADTEGDARAAVDELSEVVIGALGKGERAP